MHYGVKPESLEEALGNLLFFDARCLERETRRELMRVLPQLVHAGRSWMARFAEYGCLCCHKKKVPYGAGALCSRCLAREFTRIREWYRKQNSDVDGPVASITLRYA